MFDMWVPRGGPGGNKEVNQVSTGRYDALREEEQVTGFIRPEDLI